MTTPGTKKKSWRLAISDGYHRPDYPRTREMLQTLNQLAREGLISIHTGVQPWNSLFSFLRFLWQTVRFAFSKGIEDVDTIFILVPDYSSVSALRLHRWVHGQRFRIIFDPFISQYDTYVFNKELSWRPFQKQFLKFSDRIAFESADLILMDTDKHADYLASLLGVSRQKFQKVLVGFQREIFLAESLPPESFWEEKPLRVLWYGKPSAVHSLETVLDAILQTSSADIEFTLVSPYGRCNMEKVSALVTSKRLRFIEVPVDRDLPLETIRDQIRSHHIILGGFGSTRKASVVVMNKEYEALGMARVLVTRDGDREFLRNGLNCLQVPPKDPMALAECLHQLAANRETLRRIAKAGHHSVVEIFPDGYTLQRLSDILTKLNISDPSGKPHAV